jgi:hypothetical protein
LVEKLLACVFNAIRSSTVGEVFLILLTQALLAANVSIKSRYFGPRRRSAVSKPHVTGHHEPAGLGGF